MQMTRRIISLICQRHRDRCVRRVSRMRSWADATSALRWPWQSSTAGSMERRSSLGSDVLLFAAGPWKPPQDRGRSA